MIVSFRECWWTWEPQPRSSLKQSPGGRSTRSKSSPGFPGPSSSSHSPSKWITHSDHISRVGEGTGWRGVCPLPRSDLIFLHPENGNDARSSSRKASLFLPRGLLPCLQDSSSLLRPACPHSVKTLCTHGMRSPSPWPVTQRAGLGYAC